MYYGLMGCDTMQTGKQVPPKCWYLSISAV